MTFLEKRFAFRNDNYTLLAIRRSGVGLLNDIKKIFHSIFKIPACRRSTRIISVRHGNGLINYFYYICMNMKFSSVSFSWRGCMEMQDEHLPQPCYQRRPDHPLTSLHFQSGAAADGLPQHNMITQPVSSGMHADDALPCR